MRERLLTWKPQDQFKSLFSHLLAFRILDDSFFSLKAAYSDESKIYFLSLKTSLEEPLLMA